MTSSDHAKQRDKVASHTGGDKWLRRGRRPLKSVADMLKSVATTSGACWCQHQYKPDFLIAPATDLCVSRRPPDARRKSKTPP